MRSDDHAAHRVLLSVGEESVWLRPPKVTEKLVPVFISGELSRLKRACQGRTFAQRRDAAVIAVFRATGIRVSELAGIRYDARDPRRSDVTRLGQALAFLSGDYELMACFAAYRTIRSSRPAVLCRPNASNQLKRLLP